MKMLVDGVGRVTIPKELRKRYNLQTGERYKIIACDDYIKVEPLKEYYNINSDDMRTLRKLYLQLMEDNVLSDECEFELSKITRKSELNCEKCGSPLFLNRNDYYECCKCGDE